MLGSLLRPRNRWHPPLLDQSASDLPAQETTPFLQSILRNSSTFAPTEPTEWNECFEHGAEDDEQDQLDLDNDSVHDPLLPIFSSFHLGKQESSYDVRYRHLVTSLLLMPYY